MLSEKAAMIFILIITAFFITYFYRARDGFEPATSPWQGDTPPLSHSRIYVFNRGDRIRTCDLLVPNQAL